MCGIVESRFSRRGVAIAAVFVCAVAAPRAAAAQTTTPITRLTMDEAVRLAVDRNQDLRAQRLTIDMAKADETTAALRPKINFSLDAGGIPVFSPSQLTGSTFKDVVSYDAGLGYTFERGGKRDKRLTVARETTALTTKNVFDAERNVRFQTEQAFIAVLLAKSSLQLAQDNLKSFANVVDVNRQRVKSGDLAEGDFLMVQLQQLQFETDVSSANIALIQARAALRRLVGFDTVAEDIDAVGDLAFHAVAVTIDSLKAEALASRPDLQAAESSVRLAQDQADLERGNRARDIGASAGYNKTGPDNTVGVGVSFDLPIGDRNQGNIAHADIAVRQAVELQAAVRSTVLTDVTTAFAAYQTNAQVVKLYESGYLDQAKQSLEISRYAYQRGAADLLSLLDAERTNRTTQQAYRQALADFLSSVVQVNFVVGKQVMR